MPCDAIYCFSSRNFASVFATFAVLLDLPNFTAKYAKGFAKCAKPIALYLRGESR